MNTAHQPSLGDPLVSFEPIDRATLNDCLVQWNHQMGPFTRAEGYGAWYHALFHRGQPVAVVAAATLITPTVAGIARADAVELARLCAVRPGLCRVALRLWREFVFPALGYTWALSYQDIRLHTGDTYRFDGWVRLVEKSHSGTDKRTGRKGRDKAIWAWTDDPQARKDARNKVA